MREVTLDWNGKGTKIRWRLGFKPECNCFLARWIPFVPCYHIIFISERRKVGDSRYLFKEEGGRL